MTSYAGSVDSATVFVPASSVAIPPSILSPNSLDPSTVTFDVTFDSDAGLFYILPPSDPNFYSSTQKSDCGFSV